MLNTGLIVLTFSCIVVSVTGDTCTYHDAFNNYESFSCPRYYESYDEYYCCGSGSSQYCCDYDDYYDVGVRYVNVPGIVGGVISFLLFVGLIVAFSICCCVASCPLYQRRHQGRVMATGRGAIVVSQTQHTHRVPPPPPAPGQAYPLYPQYGMGNTYTGQYGNNRPAPYGNGYTGQPGMVYGRVTQQQPAHLPPPPNYNQSVQSQSQTVTVASDTTPNPVYPPV